MTKCLPHIMATLEHRTRRSGNPIKTAWADKRDEHAALQVIPNFTPQHFSSIAGMGCAMEKGKAVNAMKNSV